MRSAAALLALCLAPLAASADPLAWSKLADPLPRQCAKNGPVEVASPGGGSGAALLFGGWTATAAAVRGWADGIYSGASPSLQDLGIGRVYSVPGPCNSGYPAGARELDAQKLVKDVADADPSFILVAAHSSGAFVADQFLAALAKAAPGLLARVAFFKLDGGWSGDFNKALAGKLGAFFCVAAKCGKVASRNYFVMNGCGKTFGKTAQTVVVASSVSGCRAGDCCHDSLITTKPHDPNHFSVVKDYTDFTSGRAPVTGWLADPRVQAKVKQMTGQ